jgi:hypothetical protein
LFDRATCNKKRKATAFVFLPAEIVAGRFAAKGLRGVTDSTFAGLMGIKKSGDTEGNIVLIRMVFKP